MAASRGEPSSRGTAYGRLHEPGVPLISFALPPSKFLPPLRGSKDVRTELTSGARGLPAWRLEKGDKKTERTLATNAPIAPPSYDALAFRGRSPCVTKSAAHPRVLALNLTCSPLHTLSCGGAAEPRRGGQMLAVGKASKMSGTHGSCRHAQRVPRELGSPREAAQRSTKSGLIHCG